MATGPIPDGVPPRLRQPRKRGKDTYAKLRLSHSAKAEYQSLAAAYGLTVSDLIDRSVRGQEMPIFDKAIALKAATLSGRIGQMNGLLNWVRVKKEKGAVGQEAAAIEKALADFKPYRDEVNNLRELLKEALRRGHPPRRKVRGEYAPSP